MRNQYNVKRIYSHHTHGLDATVLKSNYGDPVTTDVGFDDVYESAMVF